MKSQPYLKIFSSFMIFLTLLSCVKKMRSSSQENSIGKATTSGEFTAPLEGSLCFGSDLVKSNFFERVKPQGYKLSTTDAEILKTNQVTCTEEHQVRLSDSPTKKKGFFEKKGSDTWLTLQWMFSGGKWYFNFLNYKLADNEKTLGDTEGREFLAALLPPPATCQIGSNSCEVTPEERAFFEAISKTRTEDLYYKNFNDLNTLLEENQEKQNTGFLLTGSGVVHLIINNYVVLFHQRYATGSAEKDVTDQQNFISNLMLKNKPNMSRSQAWGIFSEFKTNLNRGSEQNNTMLVKHLVMSIPLLNDSMMQLSKNAHGEDISSNTADKIALEPANIFYQHARTSILLKYMRIRMLLKK